MAKFPIKKILGIDLTPFRFSKTRIKIYRATTEQQSDNEFIIGCGLPQTTNTNKFVLDVRSVIAELGKIESSYIRYNASFMYEIHYLPFWDSLDAIEMIMALEEKLKFDITDGEIAKMQNPDLTGEWTVKDLIKDIYAAIKDKI
jgi:acyl carrier protein